MTSRWNALAYILIGLSWLIAAVLLALVVIIIATSRSVQDGSSVSHVPALTGTPRGAVSAVLPVATGGVPPTYAALGSMVEAEIGSVLIGGKASWMPEKYGRNYLAMRIPKGTEVRICAATCWDAVVHDYGPSKRIFPDRIADIAVVRWEAICGLPRSAGICEVTVEYGGGGPLPSLPPTDMEAP